MPDILINLVVFVLGAGLALFTLYSAVRTFLVPRGINDILTRIIFIGMFNVFRVWLKGARTYHERDNILVLYIPITLLLMPVAWLTLVMIGYTGIFWAMGIQPWSLAFTTSGSSLLTLGFATVNTMPQTLVAFSEAMIGLILVALLISYLPTMYSAYSKREVAVTMLATRAGTPPSAIEMIKRYHRFRGLARLNEVWVTWEMMFAEIEETHTTLAPMSFFRSHQPEYSWLTAAGAVLDGAALQIACIDQPADANAYLCIRSGYLCLRHIATFFAIPYNPDPKPDDPISITREEFDAALADLEQAGVPLKTDRDQAWHDFAGWRVNYDYVLRVLCGLVSVPPAPWSGDRALPPRRIDITHSPENWLVEGPPRA